MKLTPCVPQRRLAARQLLFRAVLSALLLVLLAFGVALAQDDAVVDLGKGVAGNVTQVENGVLVEFLLSYSCASVATDCENVTIVDTLPPGVVFVDANGTQHVESITPDSPAPGQVTIDFEDPLPGGSSGVISIFVMFPPGTIPPDLPENPVTNTAVIDADNAPPVTDSAEIALGEGTFEVDVNKRQLSPSGNAVYGEPIVFELEFCNVDNAGAVDFIDPVLVDKLPPGAEYVSSSPEGVYDPGAGTVTWENLTPNPLPVGECITTQVTIIYEEPPDPPIPPEDLVNVMEVTGTPDGCQDGRISTPPAAYCPDTAPIIPTVTITDDNSFILVPPYGEWGVSKGAQTDSTYEHPISEALPGEQITYDLNVTNSGFLTVTNVVITDTLPAEVIFDQVSFAPFEGTDAITVSYSLRGSGGLFTPFPAPGGLYTAPATVTRLDLLLPLDVDIEFIRWEISGTVLPGASWSAQMLATVRDDVVDGIEFQNCFDISGETIDGELVAGDCALTEVIHERSIPRIAKMLTSDASVQPLETATFSITVYNAGQAHLPAIGPTMMDLLPPELVYVPGSFAFSGVTPDGVPEPTTVEAIPDFQDGRTLLRATWDPAAEIPPGGSATFTFNTRVREGTPPEVITNTANLLTLDNPLLTLNCVDDSQYIDSDDLNENDDDTEIGCLSHATVGVEVQLNVDTHKFVRGQLETEFSEFGRTVVGGIADYRLVLTNTSNVSLTNITIVDKLPHLGDTGVIDPAQRGSQWEPALQSEIVGPPGIPFTVYYSTATNPCRPDISPTLSPPACEEPNWSTEIPTRPGTPFQDITLVKSVRINLCSGGTPLEPTGCYALARDESFVLTWRMSAPPNQVGHADCQLNPVGPLCPIAWNSFGFTATGAGVRFRPSEPPKVGLALGPLDPQQGEIGDFVWLDMEGIPADGIQQPNEQGIGSVRVLLLDGRNNSVLQDRFATAAGAYSFAVLANPGFVYRVAFGFPDPEFALASPPLQGTDVLSDSNGVITTTLVGLGTQNWVVTDIISFTEGITTNLSIDQGFWFAMDFGDAPYDGVDFHYPTSVADAPPGAYADAARHPIRPRADFRLGLGALLDDEPDGIPDHLALGDDLTGPNRLDLFSGPFDDDGIGFPLSLGPPTSPIGILVAGTDNTLTITTTIGTDPSPVYLQGWIDYNRDGDWDDPGEQIFNNFTPVNGVQTASITVPPDAEPGVTYARFRISREQNLGVRGFAEAGEVEDYRLQIIGDPVKSIVATSEAHTPASTEVNGNNTHVTIGEIVRYRLTAQLPRGEVTNFRFVDDLPPDVQYLGDPTVILTATNPVSITGLITPTPGVDPASPTAGGLVTFTLGTILNESAGTEVEYIAVEFNALVLNTTGNQESVSPTDRPNTFDVRHDNFSSASNAVHITIDEPALTQSKSIVTSPPVDGGDVVTYTLVTRAGAGAHNTTAFDVVISDTIDSRLTPVPGSMEVIASAGVLTITNDSAGQLVSVTAGSMTPGSAITVTVRATVADSAQAGATIPNLVRTTWTSLPGTNGTTTNPTGQSTPGASGSETGERNGSGVPALNDYRVEASAPIRIAQPLITKLPPPRPDWTIGEYLTFTLVITTPEGTTQDLVVSDLLPAGLGFESSEVVVLASESGGLLSANYPGSVTNVTPTNSGTTWSWDFGDVVNPANNNRDDDRFLIRVRVVVSNVLANQHDVILSNTGRLVYTDATDGSTTLNTPAVTVRIVEPELILTKNAVQSPLADAGDLVTYTLTLRHAPTSTITAYNVRLTDTVPAGLEGPTFVAARYSDGTPVAGVGFTGNSLRMLNPLGTINLPYTETVTITYTVDFADSSRPGVDILNTAGAVWASLPDVTTNPQRRWDGVGSPDGQDLITSNVLNNYEVNATATARPSMAFTITKHLIDSDALHTIDPDLTIGESVTYTLHVTVTEGTLLTTTVTDALPPGLRLVSSEVITTANPTLGLAEDFAGEMSDIEDNSTGNTVAWSLGTIVNPGDNDLDNNAFLIRIVATVENVIGNQQPGTRSNTATLSIEETPRTSNAVVINIVEPTLQISKSVETVVPNPDAGDAVTYTVVLRHAPQSIEAFDVLLMDELPGQLVSPNIESITTASGATIGGAFTGNTLRVPASGSLALTTTEVITVVYSAIVMDGILPDLTITNTAGAVWASLPSTYLDRRDDGVGEPDGINLLDSGALDDYEVNASAAFITSGDFFISKHLINSNADHTADPDLTIGESVTYTLRLTFTEDSWLLVRIADTLPPGLRLVSQEVITEANPRLGLANDFSGTFFGATFIQSGGSLVWGFSSIEVPGDNITDNDTFLIRIVAVVENLLSNQQPGVRTNTAQVAVSQVGEQEADPVDVNLVEPTLSIDKSVATDPLQPTLDAGDIVTYTLVIRHVAPSIDAQDVIITDTLPATLDGFSAPIITSSLGRTLGGAITGNTLRIPAGSASTEIAANEVITVVYTADLSDDIRAGVPIVNAACTTWASLPDGLNDADRRIHGDGLVSGSGLNNYETCDTTTITPNGAHEITKHLIESDANHTTDPDLTIGESVTYTLRVTVTEGTWTNVLITDVLPAGLRLTAQEVITEANAVLGLANDFGGTFSSVDFSQTPTAQEDTLVWNLGTVVNGGDNDADNDTFLIRIQAVVENVIDNQQPGTRTNTAAMIANGVVEDASPVVINIVEPTLEIEKSVQTNPLAPLPDAGDTVTYTLVVRQAAGSIAAQNVFISDTLPASLVSPNVLSVVSSEGTALGAIVLGQTVRVPALGSMTLTETEVITVVYTAVLGNNVQPGVPITNEGCTTWASLPNGLNDDDRRLHGDGLLGAGGLNDYEVCAMAVFTPTGAYSISKTLVSASAPHTVDPDVTIGEVVTYSLQITMSEGTWLNTIVTDTIPAGLLYLGGTTVLDAGGFGGSVNPPTVTAPPANPAGGGNLVLDFGTVVVFGDNVPANNSFKIRFQARVMDVVGNVGLPGAQTTLINGASMRAGGLPPEESNEVDIVVVEPRMEIVKTITPTLAAPQSIVTVTIVVSNTGLSTAFESIMSDAVPAGLTYVPGTFAETQNNGTPATLDDTASPTLVARYSLFPINTQSVLTFLATIDAAVTPGSIIRNVATIADASTLPGDDPNERTEPPAEDDATVQIVSHDLVIDKTNGQTDYTAGGLLTYTLTITNVGQAIAPGVTITEVVPVATTFVAAGSTPGWMRAPLALLPCADGDPAGTTCVIAVGDVQPSQTLSVTFVVRVDNPLPDPAPVIANAACVDNDGSLGPEPTPENNCDSHDNNFLLAQLGDRVWVDDDGNGLQDPGEADYPGMVIELYPFGSSTVMSTTTSAADGSYYFTNLPPGDYQVRFVPVVTPLGVNDPVITFQHQGDSALDSDAGRPDGYTDAITLAGGEVNHTIDAGVYYLSAIGDFVWHDLNANGIQEDGEPGIRGISVYLIVDNNIISTTTTNLNGFYIFSDLDFGDYSVRLGDTPNYLISPAKVGTNDGVDSDFAVDTRETEVLAIRQSLHFMDMDAGLHQLATLGDRVWNDTNANGVQDEGELGIANAVVTLTSPTYPGLTLSTTTGLLGRYEFTGLVPGAYVVHFAQPPLHFPTLQYVGDPTTDSNADPVTGLTDPVVLISAQEDLTIDAGFYPASTLGDLVWDDLNANGMQEAGEPGIPNVDVELLQGGAVVMTTTTDADGIYQFGNLPLGVYQIRVAAMTGWRVTLQNQGTNDALDSDIDPATRTSGDIVISMPGDYPNNDAGLYQPAILGDYAWHDTNGNGIQDAGEPPLAGVTVILEHPDGTPVDLAAVSAAATIVTPADGQYEFIGLTPGDYVVRFAPPTDFRITLQHAGDPALDSDADQTTGRSQVVTLLSGEVNDTIDGGFYRPASLGSYVWMDQNINGIREDDEPPVENVDVNLFRENDTSPWRTTSTDAEGTFLFTELPPGRYWLRFDPPPGLAFTWQNVGDDPMANSDVNAANGETGVFTLADGQTDLTWGAGLIVPTVDPPIEEPNGGWEFRTWLPAIQGE